MRKILKLCGKKISLPRFEWAKPWGIVLCCSLCYFWQNGNCFLGWNGVSAKFFSIPSKIYYSRAKLENNNNLARNWKKLQGTPISTQEKVSVLSKIAERATDYFPVLFCTFLASFIKQPAWLNGRSFASYERGPGVNPPRGNFSAQLKQPGPPP